MMIGILVNGKFVCMGSLPYLKNKYGKGYKISIQKKDSQKDIYEKELLSVFPDAQKQNDNSEIFDSYQIPSEGFSFWKAFACLEELKKQKIVSDFNIINTTLEQVFLEFAKAQIEVNNLQNN